jgi:hypothetical protein
MENCRKITLISPTSSICLQFKKFLLEHQLFKIELSVFLKVRLYGKAMAVWAGEAGLTCKKGTEVSVLAAL